MPVEVVTQTDMMLIVAGYWKIILPALFIGFAVFLWLLIKAVKDLRSDY